MTDCVICYESVEDGEDRVECSTCHSKMHTECWEMVIDKDKCPYCRDPIDVDVIFTKVYNIDDIKRTESESIEVIDMEIDCGMFAESKFRHIKFVNCKTTTNISKLFSGCKYLQSLDLSDLDTSNVTDMSYMFDGCSSLQTLNLSNFNTSNVTNMCGMFAFTEQLKSLDLSNFNTSKVVDMSSMFDGCSSLKNTNNTYLNTTLFKQ